MRANQNIIKVPLKINGLPDLACFESFEAFLQSLPEFLVGEISGSVTNVVISNQQPGEDERDKIWFRLTNSGTFIGVYVFSEGVWVQLFPPPNQVVWMYGDSRNIPQGYRIVDATNPNFTASAASIIMGQYIYDSSNTFFVYFAVTFEGI